MTKRELTAVAKRVGKRVRALRKAKGWSLADLAEKAGMFRTNICRVEAGRHLPSLETLLRLGKALGVSVEDLVKE